MAAPCQLHAVVRWRVLGSWPVLLANWRDERICPCRTASNSACLHSENPVCSMPRVSICWG